MRILPAIDILDGKAVRLQKGDYSKVTVYNDNPVEQAKEFEDQGAEWLHIVDLNAAKSGQPENIAVVERILAQTNLKVEIGGGLRSMDVLERLANAGAHRLVLGTALVRNPEFAEEAIAQYGDLLAAGIDAKSGEVAVDGWTQGSGLSAEELAGRMCKLGYHHLVYTDIARDGMQTGIDEQAYVKMALSFGNPVVASGGVANIDDIRRLAAVGKHIEGVIAGRAIYEGTLNLAEALAVASEV